MDNKIGIPIAQGEGLPQAVTSALPASASVSGSTGLSCELSCELRTFITSIHVFFFLKRTLQTVNNHKAK